MTSHQAQEWPWAEGLALGLLRELEDPLPPINAFTVANACGLEVHGAPIRKAFLLGNVIQINPRLPLREQHAAISHEVGHWLGQQEGEADTEGAATYIGASFMLPRVHYCRSLTRTQWDLRELYAINVYCPMWMLAYRITTLRSACMAVWERGWLKQRIVSAGLPSWLARRVTPFERELANAVLDRGHAIRSGNLLWGVPDFEDGVRRVITICDAEELSSGCAFEV